MGAGTPCKMEGIPCEWLRRWTLVKNDAALKGFVAELEHIVSLAYSDGLLLFLTACMD